MAMAICMLPDRSTPPGYQQVVGKMMPIMGLCMTCSPDSPSCMPLHSSPKTCMMSPCHIDRSSSQGMRMEVWRSGTFEALAALWAPRGATRNPSCASRWKAARHRRRLCYLWAAADLMTLLRDPRVDSAPSEGGCVGTIDQTLGHAESGGSVLSFFSGSADGVICRWRCCSPGLSALQKSQLTRRQLWKARENSQVTVCTE
jgi:hypothetical protein